MCLFVHFRNNEIFARTKKISFPNGFVIADSTVAPCEMIKLNDEATFFFFISLVEEFLALRDISSELYLKTNFKASIWKKIVEEMFARFLEFAPDTVGE